MNPIPIYPSLLDLMLKKPFRNNSLLGEFSSSSKLEINYCFPISTAGITSKNDRYRNSSKRTKPTRRKSVSQNKPTKKTKKVKINQKTTITKLKTKSLKLQ